MERFTLFKLILLANIFLLASCSQDPDDDPEVTPKEKLNVVDNVGVGLVTHYKLDGNAEEGSNPKYNAYIKGNPSTVTGVDGSALSFNEDDGDNGCGQPGGDYIQLPVYGKIWTEGFTVAAWVKFMEIRHYERIIDLGNGIGESGGLPVTFSRLEETNDLALTSWTDDAENNRNRGRLIAKDGIKNDTTQFYVGTIDKDGKMAIYINGKKVAERLDGQAVVNIERSSNFIGHSNYCADDPDFKGMMDDVKVFNYSLTDKEVMEMYNNSK